MSKAFTKEDDDAPVAAPRRLGVPVPVPNFVTAAGLVAVRAELDQLTREHGDPDRIRELGDHLATAQAADVPDPRVVGIGATVVVEDDGGETHTFRVVGAIEADAKRGLVSWQSPIATALWGARAGDVVELPRRGDVTVVAVTYA